MFEPVAQALILVNGNMLTIQPLPPNLKVKDGADQ